MFDLLKPSTYRDTWQEWQQVWNNMRSDHPWQTAGKGGAPPGFADYRGGGMTLDGFGNMGGGDPVFGGGGAGRGGGWTPTFGDRLTGGYPGGTGGNGGSGTMNTADYWTRQFANTSGQGKIPGSLAENASTVARYQNPAFRATTPTAYGTLMGILQSRGRTDPTLFNRQILANDRGTQASMDAVQGMMAQNNLQNSGVNAAIQGAIGAGGAQRNAQTRAAQTQLEEQRMRDDLDLFLKMVLNPSTDQAALALNQYNQSANRDMQKDAAKYQAYAAIADALLG